VHPRAIEGTVGRGSVHSARWAPLQRPLGARATCEACVGWTSTRRSAGDACDQMMDLSGVVLSAEGPRHATVVANGEARRA
jgi:hypothetical protein